MDRVTHPEFQPITFFDLLRLTSKFEATDARDKIFAILGLPTQDSDPERGILFVDPDYTLSQRDVYRTVAMKIFEASWMPFDLLSAVEHGHHICETSPSWVPQWDVNSTLDLVSHRPNSGYKTAGEPWENGMRPVARRWIFDDNFLSFGFQYDTIAHSTERLSSRGDSNEWYRKTICSWLENLPLASKGGRNLWECVAWVLLAGKDWYGNPISSLEGIWDIDEPSESALTTAWAYCRNRKVFSTACGALGLGPAALVAGDKVCVLFGATIPFVLHPRKRYHLLAGGCYLHEVMHGELVEEWRQGKRAVEFFQIR